MAEPTKSKIIDALLSMRAKIMKGWCQNAYAKLRNGETCGISDENACEWALEGAIMASRIYSTHLNEAFRVVINKRMTTSQIERTPIFQQRLIVWNDHVAKSKEDVLMVIDEVIDHISREKF